MEKIMNKKKALIIKDIIIEQNKNAMFIEELFDIALIGYGKSCGGNCVAVYDTDKCFQILIKKYNMDEVEAYDHFHKSVSEAESNTNKPIFINDFRRIKEIEWEINEEFLNSNIFKLFEK